jgi:hypothetical protein
MRQRQLKRVNAWKDTQTQIYVPEQYLICICCRSLGQLQLDALRQQLRIAARQEDPCLDRCAATLRGA